MRKSGCGLVAAMIWLYAAGVAPAAHAQAFPSKPVRIVVPASAGGPTDSIGRILATQMAQRYDVPVIVENKPGASGSIGVHAVVQSPPDGYTLLVSAPDAVTVYPLVRKDSPYKSTDLTPITRVASTPYVFGVTASLPAETMQDFVALAKKQRFAMATPGAGTSGRIVLEMLAQRADIDLLHVAYKGAGPALLSVIAGETQITASSPVTFKGHIDSGKLRALAVSQAKRNPVLPDVPTLIESGFEGFDVSAWFGIFAPPGVPTDVAAKLNEMVVNAMQSQEYVSRMGALGLDTQPLSLGEFGDMLAAETQRWEALVESANIEVGE